MSLFPFLDATSSRMQRWAVGFQQATAAEEGGRMGSWFLRRLSPDG